MVLVAQGHISSSTLTPAELGVWVLGSKFKSPARAASTHQPRTLAFLNYTLGGGTHGIHVGVKHNSGELFLLLYHRGLEGQTQALRVDNDPWTW